MSRIGKQPITVPSGVDVTIDGDHVTVKGPKGSSSTTSPAMSPSTRDGDELSSSRAPTTRAATGRCTVSARSLIANMVVGVSEGFVKELEIVGVGYRAAGAGPRRHRPRSSASRTRFAVKAPAGIKFEVPQPTRITVRGYDKQLVGQVAADIRKIRKPEPYKGKGIRYADERVLRKAGKSAK